MDTVTLNGKVYVKAKKVADEFGYAPDYIGQLCREGVLDATMLGKAWYVVRESVSEHKDSQTRQNTVTTKRSFRKQKTLLTKSPIKSLTKSPIKSLRSRSLLDTKITYTPDTSELLPAIIDGKSILPTVFKASPVPMIETVVPDVPCETSQVDKTGSTEIENKTRGFGSINMDIRSRLDDPVNPSIEEDSYIPISQSTSLEDRWNNESEEIQIPIRTVADDIALFNDMDTERDDVASDFVQVQESLNTPRALTVDTRTRPLHIAMSSREKISHPFLGSIAVFFLVLLVSVGLLCIESTWSFSARRTGTENGGLTTSYTFASFKSTLVLIKTISF